MNGSDERIQFIASYISAYEERIKLLNINGIFDAAKLFELFAIEVGSLYLGQRLSNLNVDTYTYPCVDLISEDRQTYIQVSTAKDLPSKIRETLKGIKDSKRIEINTLTNVKFFVLNNESVNKVQDYIGNEQIGNTPFVKSTDLITTRDIMQKAMDDLNFQKNLYELLKSEADSIKDNVEKFKSAVEISKSIGLNNIDCKINNEYEVDRSELISKIKADNYNNIAIQGRAGSGKSALCKKIVEGEENIIYARAERLIEESDLNNVWGFDVGKTLEYLNGKPVVFFIDALEFIADHRTKLDLLCVLYEIAKKYPYTRIITSCRTSDKNAFIKIENDYAIYSYEVPELSLTEQEVIGQKYSIIKIMLNMNSYVELLQSPFYVNLIVSKITAIDDISDENQLREYIWRHIICLDNNENKKVVNSIVFTRAKEFSLGVDSLEYDTQIIKKLISEDVIVDNGKTVRLKYDIFEDICFEQYLDSIFNKCKGKYVDFFKEIETLGRCIYRRYQIWISNKLFAKNNRERFLSELVFSNQMPEKWRKQTQIGLVKSMYCDEFFHEYGQKLIDTKTFNEFIQITNLYAFEIDNNRLAKKFSYIQLRPNGQGRKCLINLISEKKLYEQYETIRSDIEKICTDYARVLSKEKQTAENCCNILQYIVDEYMNEYEEYKLHNLDRTINDLLAVIYQMTEYSKKWIEKFWERLSARYKEGDCHEKRLAEDIIEDTLKFKHTKLAKYLAKELCDLGEMFWTYTFDRKNIQDKFGFYERDRDTQSHMYGLSKKADDYENGHTNKTAFENNFFTMLFRENFWIGLNWAIDFVNKAVLNLAKESENLLPMYEVNFIKDNKKKSYYGFPEMWLVASQEYQMPMIISDLIYCLKKELCRIVESDAVEGKETVKFANHVSKIIYEKSNNIAFLTIIANIGIEFSKKLPGYALDLTTNIDIILSDLTRMSFSIKNPTLQMFEKHILQVVGIPFELPDRYNQKDSKPYSLLDYFRDYQYYGDEQKKKNSYQVLDYLYLHVPNDKENALRYLQIQKMDLRNSQVVKVDDNMIALVPNITGEAEKITIEDDRPMQIEHQINLLFNVLNEKMEREEFGTSDCFEAVDSLLKLRHEAITSGIIDKSIVYLIVWALQQKDLDHNMRSNFCEIWINGIKACLLAEHFIFDYSLSKILFMQIEKDIDKDTKKQIKKLIFDLILFEGQDGVILEITRHAKEYLTTNECVARSIFNTLVKLAEDEMNHQKFNFNYVEEYRKEERFDFLPNKQPKLRGIDSYLEEEGRDNYESQQNRIVEEYLFNDAELDLSEFHMDDYDIETLCFAISCGLSLKEKTFVVIVEKFVITMIDVWKENKDNHFSHDILDVRALYEVMNFFQRELLASEYQAATVLEILFTKVDFLKFTRDTMNFYLDVFGSLLPEYFDSHHNPNKRAYIETIIYLIENKITGISQENVRTELYKSLILSMTSYGSSGDWSKCLSGYSYQDKKFLNGLFSKYGGFHLKEMLNTVYKIHFEKLLPEILLSLRDAFISAIDIKIYRHNTFVETIKDRKIIVLLLISKAFLNFSDEIKQDEDLTQAFEEILEILVKERFEEAATILDEFRIH